MLLPRQTPRLSLSPLPPLHIKTKYIPNPAAPGVPAAAARKEASGSGSAGWVSVAGRARGPARRDAVAAGAGPGLHPVLTQASPPLPRTVPFAPVSGIHLNTGRCGSPAHLFLFWILFISLSGDSVKARRCNSCFSCLLLNEADVFIFMWGGMNVPMLAGLGTSVATKG